MAAIFVTYKQTIKESNLKYFYMFYSVFFFFVCVLLFTMDKTISKNLPLQVYFVMNLE